MNALAAVYAIITPAAHCNDGQPPGALPLEHAAMAKVLVARPGMAQLLLRAEQLVAVDYPMRWQAMADGCMGDVAKEEVESRRQLCNEGAQVCAIEQSQVHHSWRASHCSCLCNRDVTDALLSLQSVIMHIATLASPCLPPFLLCIAPHSPTPLLLCIR